jgi:hypothetical protein
MYKHKLTGQKLRLKKKFGQVYVMYLEQPYFIYNNVLVDTCIVDSNNLELIGNNQLKLF